MGPLPLWFVWALGSAVFAGITAVLAKAGLEDVDPDLATLVRTGIVALFLPLLLVAAGKWSNPFELSGRTWWFLGFSGIATGLSWICYFRALKAGQASLVVPVDRLSLLVVALLAFLFLDERPSILGWIGLLLVGGGGLLFSLGVKAWRPRAHLRWAGDPRAGLGERNQKTPAPGPRCRPAPAAPGRGVATVPAA